RPAPTAPRRLHGPPVGSDTASRFQFTIPVPQTGSAADTTLGAAITALGLSAAGTSEFGATDVSGLSEGFGAPVVFAGADATVVEGQQFSGHGSFSDLDST